MWVSAAKEAIMDIFRERVAGVDISEADVKVAVRVPGSGRRRSETVRTFGTTTVSLLALADWLAEQRVELVVMESTGVYWKPVFYTLEGQFTCWLLNPQQVKKVPGRKTDVTDAQWLARLAEYGLVRPSFVPPAPIRQLRDLTRYRTNLVRERVRAVQRLHDLLQDAGIKLGQVASDITGASGRAMLAALIAGQQDSAALADLAKGRMRQKIPALTDALTGHFTAHHAHLATLMLRRIDGLLADLAEVEATIQDELRPFAAQAKRLQTIPGVSERAAAVIIAELGVDMTRFPTAAHASSWAGLCPGNNQSGRRNLGGKTRHGNPQLGSVLYECAFAASRTKGTYLADRYQRLAFRRGRQRALVAVSRTILEAAWKILCDDVAYRDLGSGYLASIKDPERRARRLVAELKKVGYEATLTPVNAA